MLLGASESISALLGVPFAYALVAIFIVQIVYTAVGGYVADVWSDTLQAAVMLVATLVLPLTLVAKLGGWGSTWRSLRDIDQQLLQAGETSYSLTTISTAAPLLLILGIALSGGLKFVSDPRQLSRFYGLRSKDAARNGVLTVTILVAVTYLFLLPLGLLARVPPTGGRQRTS